MFILMNWRIIRGKGSDGRAVTRVGGQVYGHARFRAGETISTSPVACYRAEGDSAVIVTHHGSEYVLGKPHASEPFALRRLVRYLDERSASSRAVDPEAVTQQLSRADELAIAAAALPPLGLSPDPLPADLAATRIEPA